MSRKSEFNALALGYAGAAISAASMLLLGIGWNIGIYQNTAMQMAKWHMFFSPTIGGIIGGMIEAAVISFIFLYAFGRAYNKFANG